MTLIQCPEYHEEDLWYNTDVLQAVSLQRNIETEVLDSYPVFLYRWKSFPLKIKAHIPWLNHLSLVKIVSFAREKKVPSLEIITNQRYKNIEVLPFRMREFRSATFLIDLTQSQEEIFAGFTSGRRNHIKKAMKENLSVRTEWDENIFNQWWNIYRETVQRQGFVSQNHEFVLTLLRKGICKLFTAWLGKEMISGSLVVCNNYPMWWLGASLRQYSQLNAPSLIQWKVIEWAGKEGYNFYDMGGASLASNHGPTNFKKTFGGELVKNIHYEVIFSPFWNKIVNTIRDVYYKKLKKSAY